MCQLGTKDIELVRSFQYTVLREVAAHGRKSVMRCLRVKSEDGTRASRVELAFAGHLRKLAFQEES